MATAKSKAEVEKLIIGHFSTRYKNLDPVLEEAKEVQHLRGYTALKTVGYRELFEYLDGQVTGRTVVDLTTR